MKMKRLIEVLLAILIILMILEPCAAHAVATDYKSEKSEELVWNELSKYSPSDAVTAGIMGYFYRESQMRFALSLSRRLMLDLKTDQRKTNSSRKSIFTMADSVSVSGQIRSISGTSMNLFRKAEALSRMPKYSVRLYLRVCSRMSDSGQRFRSSTTPIV